MPHLPNLTPPNSRETLPELAVSHPDACRQNPRRRSGRLSRAAAAFGLALIIAVGMAGTPGLGVAESSIVVNDDEAASDLVRDSQTDLQPIFEKIGNELDRRVRLKTEAIIEQVTELQVSALLQQFEQKLAVKYQLSRRVERQLAEVIQ